MFWFEKKGLGWLKRNILFFAFGAAVLLSALLRIQNLSFCTWDMEGFFLPWTEVFRQEGIAALRHGVGNYTIPYMLYIYAVSVFTSEQAAAVVMVKALAVVFDYLLAAGIGLVVYTLHGGTKQVKTKWGALAFAATLFVPQVLLNASLWGQCDSIYVAFGVFAVYFLLKQNWPVAFLMLSLSFCFKMQSIFLLPLFIFVYAAERRFSVFWFGLPPLLLFVTSLPAVFVGASPFVAFQIYMGQTEYDTRVFIDYPNAAAFIQDERHEYFAPLLIGAALLLCFLMLCWVLYKNMRVRGLTLLQLAAWSALACVLFLPSMHDRYGYLAEVLLWACFFVRPAGKRLWPAVLFTLSGYCAYASYLFGFWPLPKEVLAAANLLAFVWYTWQVGFVSLQANKIQ